MTNQEVNMEDSVTTLNICQIRRNACFTKAEFEIVRNSILKHLLAYGVMTTEKLGTLVEDHLKTKFDESIYRFYESVRQVLEARGEIRYVSNSKTPLIELAD